MLQVTQTLEQEALRLVKLTQEHERDASQILHEAIDKKDGYPVGSDESDPGPASVASPKRPSKSENGPH